MKSLSGRDAFRLAGTFLLLLVCAGCYDPKKDIEVFRPEGEKYLAAMEKVGRTVAALPPLTGETMTFPAASSLSFFEDQGAPQNIAVIHLEELSDIGQSHIYNRVISEEYYKPAWLLLQRTPNEYIKAATKENIPYRFRRLLEIRYLVVLRVQQIYSEVTGPTEFKGGEIRGEAILCEVNDAATVHGGFSFLVRSSAQVQARVRGDRAQQNIDRSLALRKDLEEQAVRMIHDKLKARLPEAHYPSYW